MTSRKGQIDEATHPCGKCPQCLKRLVSGWSFRLMQQLKVSMSAHFITLTYDTKHVPITDRGFMSLDKRDCRMFFKQLRRLHSGDSRGSIRYFIVGEYGGRTMRPHYHIILYNAQLELIQLAWTKGSVHYGDKRGVTEASVGYTLKYMMKPGKIPVHRNDDRLPEFRRMSKKLGANYLTDAMIKWHKNDLLNRMYCNLPDGKKISMPRYYKDKIYTDAEREDIAYAMLKKLQEQKEQYLKEFGDEYYEMLKRSIGVEYSKMYKQSQLNRNL